jgi:SAM-dependent methyltransferase
VSLPKCEDHLELLERAGDHFRGSLWRFRSNSFDEVHAYEVLEHLGHQGNAAAFFRDFAEIWRILTPGGFLCATVPSRFSPWLWGDPGHTRAILPAHLIFLYRPHYDAALGTSPSSDYRPVYPADFDILHTRDNEETHTFVLQAVKPIRPPAERAP